MATITVRRNWKKKIEALTAGNPIVTIYTLDNCFVGEDIKRMTDMTAWLNRELGSMLRSDLRYNKDTGHCVLHIHSNLWFEWNQKISW